MMQDTDTPLIASPDHLRTDNNLILVETGLGIKINEQQKNGTSLKSSQALLLSVKN